jgi:uncharacterized protein
MQMTQQQRNELVRRVVGAVHPLRIIQFGAAARAEMGLAGDVGVLVVMPEGTSRRETIELLQRRFIGLPLSVDVLVVTPEHLLRHPESTGLIYSTILDEGRVLYAA